MHMYLPHERISKVPSWFLNFKMQYENKNNMKLIESLVKQYSGEKQCHLIGKCNWSFILL